MPLLAESPALPDRALLTRRDWAVLGVAAVAYVPLLFLGYGADVDAYAVLEAAERIAEGAPYAPSRQPGFLVHEVATTLLDGLGGSLVANAGTALMALLALGSFLALCRRLGVPHRALLALTLALHPFFWVNAGSTIDYAWALGFALAGGVLLLDERWAGAGVLFALAIGARGTSVLLVAALLGFMLWRSQSQWRGVATAGALAVALGGLCYVPTIFHYGGTLGFLVPVGAEDQAAWTWMDRIGRFGYKNVYLWGLPAALLLLGLLPSVIAALRRPGEQRPLLVLCAAIVLAFEALFLRYPLEPAYLLPILPFVLVALGLTVGRRWLVAFLALVLAYNVVSVNVARPDRPLNATRAEVGLWVEPGYLVQDVAERLRYVGCRTIACWHERYDAASRSAR